MSETSSLSPAADEPLAGNGADVFAQHHFLRNATCLAVENALFLVAIAFVGETTVLPTFVTLMGGSAMLVGLVSTCHTAGWLLPQIVGASLCAGKPRMLPYILGPLYVGRPAFLVVAAAALFFGQREPWLLLVIFYLAILVFFASDGLASVAWFELIGRTIPANRRGRMLGTARVAGGLGGIAAGGVVGWLLTRPDLPFPASYAVVFGLSGVLFCVGVFPFFLMREPLGAGPDSDRQAERPPAQAFLSLLLPILTGDRNFLRLIATRLLFGTITATFPFYVLYMSRVHSMGQDRIGMFLSAQVFGGLLSGLAVGWIADRLGTKVAIRTSTVAAGAVPITGLAMLGVRGVPEDVYLYLGLTLFGLMGLAQSSTLLSFMNYLLEAAPVDLRSTYVGLFNTLAGALLVVPPLAGWLLEATSFSVLFAATALTSVLCLLATLRLAAPARA